MFRWSGDYNKAQSYPFYVMLPLKQIMSVCYLLSIIMNKYKIQQKLLKYSDTVQLRYRSNYENNRVLKR